MTKSKKPRGKQACAFTLGNEVTAKVSGRANINQWRQRGLGYGEGNGRHKKTFMYIYVAPQKTNK